MPFRRLLSERLATRWQLCTAHRNMLFLPRMPSKFLTVARRVDVIARHMASKPTLSDSQEVTNNLLQLHASRVFLNGAVF